MKRMMILMAAGLLVALLTTPTWAASRYWVGGSDNWDATAGTKWATTSGGAGGAAVPGSSDDVHFDTNSGSGTVTIPTGNVNALSVNFSGFTGTLAGTGQINSAGSVTLSSTMTLTHTGTTSFTNTATYTTAGKTILGVIYVSEGTHILTLGDNLTSTATSSIILNSGVLVTNGVALNIKNLSFSGTSTRTLNVTNSAITCTAWTGTDPTNLTFIGTGSSITMSGTGPFAGGGLTYPSVTFTGSPTITGSNTFTSMAVTSHPSTVTLTAGSTTSTQAWNINGISGSIVTLQSSSGTQANLVLVGGGTSTSSYAKIIGISASPASSWFGDATVVDGGNNTGWVFAATPKMLFSLGTVF